ncbi:MAG TPA: class I SAM-dependent methyltransferase, partial [Nitrososphaeraceae archaeon]|nr:class I SAM-dependent methyltransferase [Nitrososphaeraceae archaeon]
FEECIKEAWSETYPQEINIADIGCGTGSAITYLANLKFGKVDYVGLDVSIKIMKLRTQSGEIFPNNWQIRFMRASANINIFKENSLDIVFSASALHHLELESVMEWVSKALKPNGLLILHEPSSGNIFSKIGRKLVKDFHTEGEKPILPKDVKQIAHNHNLNLIYEKGLHYLTGSLQYLMGILRLPIPLSFCVYQVSRLVDSFTTSPSWNYSFIQVYKKIK